MLARGFQAHPIRRAASSAIVESLTRAPVPSLRSALQRPGTDTSSSRVSLLRRLTMSTSSLAVQDPSASMTTTRTAMRQNKLVVSAPASVSRLTGNEPQLETMQGAQELLEQLKPSFTSQHSLQAIGLSGRQLPLLTKDEKVMPYLFNAAGVRYVQPHPNGDPSQRVLLLNVPATSPTPDVIVSTILQHGLEHILSFDLSLGYDNLSSDQILEALLPSTIVSADGVPTGFTIVGHIAHLNLLPTYLPFRYLVGSIILSKHAPALRTVVNKLDSIDTQFRFFQMELLAGEPEYIARVSESDCTFEFDFRTVYWNSRLHAEHMRLIRKCRPNQVLADVMAGVGPFAVPAAKRGAWVLANDLNPSSYESLAKNAKLNKVELEDKGRREQDGGLMAKCMDGREFVKWSMIETWNRGFAGRPRGFDGEDEEAEDERLRESARKQLKEKAKKNRALHAARQATPTDTTTTAAIANLSITDTPAPPIERHPSPRLVSHFIMNLPASALEFLDAFIGAYTHLSTIVGKDALLSHLSLASSSPHLHPLPMIHVHCFSKDPFTPALDILTRANAALSLPPDSPHRLKSKPILPPPQTFAGLRKSLSPTQDVGNYLTSHPNYHRYSSLNSPQQFMHAVEQEWLERDAGEHTPELSIHYVRDVAPNKQMYCLSFRCPEQVLWADETQQA